MLLKGDESYDACPLYIYAARTLQRHAAKWSGVLAVGDSGRYRCYALARWLFG